jgi:hypothetical protein
MRWRPAPAPSTVCSRPSWPGCSRRRSLAMATCPCASAGDLPTNSSSTKEERRHGHLRPIMAAASPRREGTVPFVRANRDRASCSGNSRQSEGERPGRKPGNSTIITPRPVGLKPRNTPWGRSADAPDVVGIENSIHKLRFETEVSETGFGNKNFPALPCHRPLPGGRLTTPPPYVERWRWRSDLAANAEAVITCPPPTPPPVHRQLAVDLAVDW